MAADEINNSAADDAGEPTGAESVPVEPTTPEAESTPGPGWTRRAFFQAAALGAAAAAFLDGKRFAPSIAWANDLSTDSCTANDVQIVGPGVILDEPCTCTGGTFPAVVAFPVYNNTNTD